MNHFDNIRVLYRDLPVVHDGDGVLVQLLCRADVEVVGDVQPRVQGLERGGVFARRSLRSQAKTSFLDG